MESKLETYTATKNLQAEQERLNRKKREEHPDTKIEAIEKREMNVIEKLEEASKTLLTIKRKNELAKKIFRAQELNIQLVMTTLGTLSRSVAGIEAQ